MYLQLISWPKDLQWPESISILTMEDRPLSRKNTTAASGEIPREEMADLRQSSFVTTEKGLVLMVSRLSPSIVTRQRKPSTNVTVNSWLRMLLETKLFSLGTFHVKYWNQDYWAYFVSKGLNIFGGILSLETPSGNSKMAIPEDVLHIGLVHKTLPFLDLVCTRPATLPPGRTESEEMGRARGCFDINTTNTEFMWKKA